MNIRPGSLRIGQAELHVMIDAGTRDRCDICDAYDIDVLTLGVVRRNDLLGLSKSKT